MESVINIGGRVEKDTADNLGRFISTVFKAGKDNGMEQATIVEALNLVGRITSANGATIANSNFIGEKHVHTEETED